MTDIKSSKRNVLGGMWMYGFVDFWMFGFSDVRMYGCMDVRMYGCADVWLFGSSVVRMSEFWKVNYKIVYDQKN
ncbi:MAG: hypothetical protein R2730_11350 [Chitinophagales bacterium]